MFKCSKHNFTLQCECTEGSLKYLHQTILYSRNNTLMIQKNWTKTFIWSDDLSSRVPNPYRNTWTGLKKIKKAISHWLYCDWLTKLQISCEFKSKTLGICVYQVLLPCGRLQFYVLIETSERICVWKYSILILISEKLCDTIRSLRLDAINP